MSPLDQSPEELKLADDAIGVRARSLSDYLAWGGRQLWESRQTGGWRLLRFPVTSLPWAILVAVTATLPWVRSLPVAERHAWLARVSHPEALIARETLLSPWPVLACFGFVLGVLVLRAVLDALLYGGVRQAALGASRSFSRRLRQGGVAFAGLAAMELGLTLGGLFFVVPLLRAVLRVVLAWETTPGAMAFALASVLVTVASVSWMRWLAVVSSAWLAWRPQFFAATLITAFIAPWRQAGHYLPLYAAWALGQAALILGAAAVLQAHWTAAGTPTVSLTLAGVLIPFALAAAALQAYTETVLIVMVGHRLGDLMPSSSASRTPQPADPNASIFDPPVQGIYHGLTDGPRTFSFVELLGYQPTDDPRAEWQIANVQPETTALQTSAFGAREVIVRLSAPTAMGAELGGDRRQTPLRTEEAAGMEAAAPDSAAPQQNPARTDAVGALPSVAPTVARRPVPRQSVVSATETVGHAVGVGTADRSSSAGWFAPPLTMSPPNFGNWEEGPRPQAVVMVEGAALQTALVRTSYGAAERMTRPTTPL